MYIYIRVFKELHDWPRNSRRTSTLDSRRAKTSSPETFRHVLISHERWSLGSPQDPGEVCTPTVAGGGKLASLPRDLST